MILYEFLLLGEIFVFFLNICSAEMMAFEPANTTEYFPTEYVSCRGRTIDNIHLIQCAAMCYDSTSPLWETAIETYNDCYCFLYNETQESDKGPCTLCFMDSQIPVSLHLNNVFATLIYAIPSLFCKYIDFISKTKYHLK